MVAGANRGGAAGALKMGFSSSAVKSAKTFFDGDIGGLGLLVYGDESSTLLTCASSSKTFISDSFKEESLTLSITFPPNIVVVGGTNIGLTSGEDNFKGEF